MNFFKWLRWVFSKHLSVDVDNCVFDNVTKNSYYQKNGVFYKYNIRHKITNCIFNAYEEPEPNVVELKIDMGNVNHTDSYMMYYGDDEIPENILIPSEDIIPFQIVYKQEPILTDYEKEERRNKRFIDAIVNWNDRGKLNG